MDEILEMETDFISEKRNTRKCPMCGTTIWQSDIFYCPVCGTKVDKE